MDVKAFARQVIEAEAAALTQMAGLIDEAFEQAVEQILACDGSVVITGVGKPWLVGQKISATLASTGTPSFALHPAEAAHGDLGRVRKSDIVVALSNSGASEEVVRLLPILKRYGIPVIGVTGRMDSDLAKHSDVVLNLGRIEEACPLKLAPSASTTAMLALGDAIALTVMERRGFTREDYARFHPGGALGRKLMHVEEVMRPLERTATVSPTTSVKDTVLRITQKQSGAAFILDNLGALLGVFTDGDLRRHLEDAQDISTVPVESVMTAPGLRIQAGELATAALHILQARKIDELPVVDDEGILIGHVDVQDLLEVGMF